MEEDQFVGGPWRIPLIMLGLISLATGIIGIAIPLLPTTPLILLAAACFTRSSTRFNTWMHTNRVLGPYIRNYQEGNGLSIRAKILTIALLWASMIISMMLTMII
jgi:uncharacterized membrane protein YbaN (DUF454 family)